jgi:hypothetical protein
MVWAGRDIIYNYPFNSLQVLYYYELAWIGGNMNHRRGAYCVLLARVIYITLLMLHLYISPIFCHG